MRNPQKIKAVRDNAAFVELVSKEHGGFGRFLADWPEDDQVGLMAYLGKHGSRLGGNTGQYFLRWLEWDAFIISSDMAAALRDAGLDIAERPTSKRDLDKIQNQINAGRRTSGCRAGIFRASWRCRSAKTIRRRHCANIWANRTRSVSGGPIGLTRMTCVIRSDTNDLGHSVWGGPSKRHCPANSVALSQQA